MRRNAFFDFLGFGNDDGDGNDDGNATETLVMVTEMMITNFPSSYQDCRNSRMNFALI